MTAELLKYVYEDRQRAGVPEAVQVSRQWLQEIFKEAWWPDDSAPHLVHYGNGASCDALKVSYQAGDAAGPLMITVFQTLFYIVVAVGRGLSGKQEAPDLGRRLFSYPERLNLTVTAQGSNGASGRQVSSGVPAGNYDWLDTIQWWSDHNLAAFEMLKRTGPGQGVIVRPEAEANRTWFAKFG